MPVKRRPGKERVLQISPQAAARWRAIRPHGLGPSYVADDALGEMVGVGAYLCQRPDTLAALRAALDEAVDGEASPTTRR